LIKRGDGACRAGKRAARRGIKAPCRDGKSLSNAPRRAYAFRTAPRRHAAFLPSPAPCIHAKAQLNPKNQLPPVVQFTMIAMDDQSVSKLDLDATYADVFGVSKLFSSTQSFTTDLATLDATLRAKKVRYRIFTTNVHIRAAKWSREQIN
jgi:uncharacterized protein (TIGR02599 family)